MTALLMPAGSVRSTADAEGGLDEPPSSPPQLLALPACVEAMVCPSATSGTLAIGKIRPPSKHPKLKHDVCDVMKKK